MTRPESAALLSWYDRHARVLPWRVPPDKSRDGRRADPYSVWLSEVMLQQTTVAAVIPYFHAFLDRWPTLADLAAAPQEEVMKAWAGLGYYSRARNLKACAERVVAEHSGAFPATADALLSLPGIGDYTAAAIAAIAFGEPVAVVDGNVERVVARLFGMETPMPAAKSDIRQATLALVPADRPGDFAQAMMDLGATICTPRRPSCLACPLNSGCRALRSGDPERFPARPAKREKPMRAGAAFVAVSPGGAVLLERRASTGLLGGMVQPPNSAWTARADGATDVTAAPFAARWRRCGSIRHVFTHFDLLLEVWRADVDRFPVASGRWWSEPHELPSEALPTVMKKAIAAALPGAFRRHAPPEKAG